jgi:hypothetical protein
MERGTFPDHLHELVRADIAADIVFECATHAIAARRDREN